MLKMVLQTDQGPIGIIGITEGNLVRMKAGMPLDINIKELTPPGTRMNRLVVHYAHTYEEIVDDMANAKYPVVDELRHLARRLDEQMKREGRQ